MTREQLFEAIGSLEEAMLDENVEQVKPRRNLGWLAGIAACAAVCAGVFFLPKLLPEENVVPPQHGVSSTQPDETATEYVGFLEGVNFYPLSEDSAPNAVCTAGEWLSPQLGGSAYFVLNENLGLYQFVDPLSSAMPETGTYTIKNNVITALSYDGTQTHTLDILDGYALELTESTRWEHLTGRIFTSRYDEEKPFSDITAAQISNVICNDWEITLDDTQMDAFAQHLRNVVRYQQIMAEEEIRYGGRFIRFTLNENGETSEITISHRLWMDGVKYLPDQESCNALFDFLVPLAEDAQEEYENTPKTLPYLHGVTYRQLAADFSYDAAYSDMTKALDDIMEIEFRSGNYRIRFSDGTEERGLFTTENGFVTCVHGEAVQHEFVIMDDYTIRLVSSSYEALDQRKDLHFTCRLYPEQYFAENVTDAKGIQCGIRNGEEVISVQLPEDKIAECLDALHEITVYSESIGALSQNIVDTANMHYLFIDRIGDAQDVQVYIGNYIAINGELYVYETDTAKALLKFLENYSTEDIPDPAQVLDDLDDFSRAEITHYVLGEHREMTDEEFAQLKELLRNIVLLEEDTSGDMLFGDTLNYTLYKGNGVSVTIQPGGNLITVGGRRFYTEYAPCEALNKFGHNILGRRFAQGDSESIEEVTE